MPKGNPFKKVTSTVEKAEKDMRAGFTGPPEDSEGRYCPHCGQHKMTPEGGELDDAQLLNSIKKIKKTVGTDL